MSEPTFRVETETVERVKHIVLDIPSRPAMSIEIRDRVEAPVGTCAELLGGWEYVPVVNTKGEPIGRIVGVEYDPSGERGTFLTVEVSPSHRGPG